ncbi:MAG: hypothetical protein ACLQBC_15285, partial [Syntrophales bacterium]
KFSVVIWSIAISFPLIQQEIQIDDEPDNLKFQSSFLLRIAPTNKYKRKTAGIEYYQFKAAEFLGKCQGVSVVSSFVFHRGKSFVQIAAIADTDTKPAEGKAVRIRTILRNVHL